MYSKKAPQVKKVSGLTDSQKAKLREHSKHHTPKHMTAMRKLMKEGMSFTKAHNQVKKTIGN
tara:strand:+ start:300 stop:485 length:186 start_codon:yes stop_codon:yes gene_type:complete